MDRLEHIKNLIRLRNNPNISQETFIRVENQLGQVDISDYAQAAREISLESN